jgi:DNA-binding NtrC family response regulator
MIRPQLPERLELERPKVLIVGQVAADLARLGAILESAGIEVLAVASMEVALGAVAQRDLDLAMIDCSPCGADGLVVSNELHEASRTALPVIYVGSEADGHRPGQALSAGVDYVTKPVQREEVLARVRRQLELARLTRELCRQSRELSEASKKLSEQTERRRAAEVRLELASERLSVLWAREAAHWGLTTTDDGDHVAQTLCPDLARLPPGEHAAVLITGERGTGKELVARALHRRRSMARASAAAGARAESGARKWDAFLVVECATLPAAQVESLLFGHPRDASSGGTDRKGYLELAHEGTLFLDEVGELPISAQTRLLRLLEDGASSPLGGPPERRLDVQVIAASSADLPTCVRAGTFRRDLYLRLARRALQVPTLRERPEDIPPLAAHFFGLLARELRVPPPIVHAEAMEALQGHGFSGNVRELKNVIEHALLASAGQAIGRSQIEAWLAPRLRGGAASLPERPLTLNLNAVKDQLITQALAQTRGNVTAAARILGVHRSWFYRRRPVGEER